MLLAFLTIFASIKLSYYGDILSKQSKIGTAFIGGLLIASITSLPEFSTSISAVEFNNPTLSLGDIVGSNMFNIFVLAAYNIYFFKSDLFKNVSRKHLIECIILIIDYFLIILGTNDVFVPKISIALIIMYIIYMFFVFKSNNKEEQCTISKQNNVILKFVVMAIIMVILSIFLTYEADKISRLYPNFSSSSIGAILLGITTSLPEVVTTFALIRLDNCDMAFSNMLGSNIFNFLVLAISDFLIKEDFIYNFSDKYGFFYLSGGILITIILCLLIGFKSKNKIYYLALSIMITLIYLYVWYLQFN